MATGSFLCGSISDAFGRKVGVLLSTFIISFVGLLTTFVPNYAVSSKTTLGIKKIFEFSLF